ncbi:hypothetical protein [Rhodoferax sp.]|uniref:hypothetical protein n=1 Tax=Rhodoferax sp. TaxID=50421 RepID=UPI0028469664|nr:hypothetical protein [Rhodoferax sp.]MDR3367990.1 hypothetical protein [Rhodoferax sp.]
MVNPARQQAFSFENDEIYSYHDPARKGFFALLTKPTEGRIKQTAHRLKDLEVVLARVDRSQNTWISQNEFFKPNRRVVNLWRLTVLFVDLDTYNAPDIANLPTQWQVDRLLRLCDAAGIPQPTLVVHSGRGLQVKWVLSHPIPSRALPRWKAVQDELCRLLLPLGADLNARDASRVLRVVETVNTKSQTRAHVVFWSKIDGPGTSRHENGAVQYDFEVLAASVPPMLRTDLQAREKLRDEQRGTWRQEKAARATRIAELTVVSGGRDPNKKNNDNLRPFLRSQLAWDRIVDIRKLAELRGCSSGFPSGERNLPLFLCACFLADAQLAQDIESELVELAGEFAPTWSAGDVKSCASAVYARAQAAARGEKVVFGDLEVDPRYRWRNATLIERLRITPAEEREMATIISKPEKRQRDVERKAKARLDAGCAPRAEWLESVEQRRAGARLLRAQGVSYRRIAAELGISVGAAHTYCEQ